MEINGLSAPLKKQQSIFHCCSSHWKQTHPAGLLPDKRSARQSPLLSDGRIAVGSARERAQEPRAGQGGSTASTLEVPHPLGHFCGGSTALSLTGRMRMFHLSFQIQNDCLSPPLYSVLLLDFYLSFGFWASWKIVKLKKPTQTRASWV